MVLRRRNESEMNDRKVLPIAGNHQKYRCKDQPLPQQLRLVSRLRLFPVVFANRVVVPQCFAITKEQNNSKDQREAVSKCSLMGLRDGLRVEEVMLIVVVLPRVNFADALH